MATSQLCYFVKNIERFTKASLLCSPPERVPSLLNQQRGKRPDLRFRRSNAELASEAHLLTIRKRQKSTLISDQFVGKDKGCMQRAGLDRTSFLLNSLVHTCRGEKQGEERSRRHLFLSCAYNSRSFRTTINLSPPSRHHVLNKGGTTNIF